MMRGLMRPLFVVAAVLFVAGTAYAQGSGIAGAVRDGSGAVMPGVKWMIGSPECGSRSTARISVASRGLRAFAVSPKRRAM